MGRTVADVERLQHAVDEEDAAKFLAERLDRLDAALVVGLRPVDGEDDRELCKLQHSCFSFLMWTIGGGGQSWRSVPCAREIGYL